MPHRSKPERDAFDERMTQLFTRLPVPPAPAFRPGRRAFLHRLAAWAGAGICATLGGMAAVSYADTPPLVRAAYAHAREEASVRGMHIADLRALEAGLGGPLKQVLPGVLQLCKDCTVAGHHGWHLTTFVDGQGYTQLFVFPGALASREAGGNPLTGYWQTLTLRGHTLLVVAPDPQTIRHVLIPIVG